ncbi:glutaredoxin domain-containing protein [Streptomyces sp. KLOTTS4A1]|uniref:glutaredoxin domain-containing protein n=1 Tax=Streptomyces sp. KLOTTS4A1 TaxID=3390996 RepID=UPI0039F5137A
MKPSGAPKPSRLLSHLPRLLPRLLPLLYLLCGAGIAAALISAGDPATAAAILFLFTLLAAVNSPLFFPRSTTSAEARRRSAADGRPIVYWRPGCRYCLRLRIRLGRRAHELHWVDIRRDPAGAELVRSANDGNETVPTVLVADHPHTNPAPAWLRDQLP